MTESISCAFPGFEKCNSVWKSIYRIESDSLTMENFPSALVIASYDSVCHNNNALYRLVRPLSDGVGVQSTDRLVNVVPFRRKYTFEKKQQLEEFGQQILRRPLVLQPVLHFGRGLGFNCALCYEDELWIVMVNQTHPKILSRLQMGLDAAKGALARGQPFEIRFRFGKLIQRVYREHLAQKEKEEAQGSSSACLTYFRFVEWEHCDLNLRYHGYGANIRSSALHSLPNLEMKWDFEDIGMHEMEWRQITGEVSTRPHLSPVFEDEIREALSGWTINGVSPLESIGDSVPEDNYNYAQAGRLYASFRKKARSRNRPQHIAVSESSAYAYDYGDEQNPRDDFQDEPEGAVGFDPSVYPEFVDPAPSVSKNDHGYDYTEGYQSTLHSKQKYVDTSSHRYNSDCVYEDVPYNSDQHATSDYDDGYSNSRAKSQNDDTHKYGNLRSLDLSPFSTTGSHPNKYGHIYANAKVVSNTSSHQNRNSTHGSSRLSVEPHHDVIIPSSEYHPYTGQFNKQDSDRFSRSTTTDSGYCPDGDDIHSRSGSYDYNDQSNMSKHKQNWSEYENFPNKQCAYGDEGLENPAFTYDYHDISHGLQKQQPVSKVIKPTSVEHKSKPIATSLPVRSSEFNNHEPKLHHAPYPKESVESVKVPPRRKKGAAVASAVPQIAESFI